ncbi:MAG: tRNA lysidine(34) synthetase TilS [Magnetococcales bacterium]|nr:tRNA lysidine(34) synthetase TilS [Magnetococcales bacterium]MBF0115014.1 tRNA lysidine(34) synthetase TilS [Magnetococcales bacterium]
MTEKASLLERFRRHARPLLQPWQRIVVAVSGGADSMALLHLLHATVVEPHKRLQVAHFDHGLRNNSAEDAQFVQAAAARLQLPCTIGHWQERAPTGNLAEQARCARYHFLLTTAQQVAAGCVMTGHHQDDQAETILERLLRGSGVHGLRAIVTQRPLAAEVQLMRPLLPFSRAVLRHWLQEQGVSWREDASNTTLRARRNRLRHEVLPVLQRVADPSLPQRLADTALRLQQADQALEWMLERLWPALDPQPLACNAFSLAVLPLYALPEELLQRCLLRCRRQVRAEEEGVLSDRAMAGFLRCLRSRRRHWSMMVRGMSIERQGERLLFRRPVGRWN